MDSPRETWEQKFPVSRETLWQVYRTVGLESGPRGFSSTVPVLKKITFQLNGLVVSLHLFRQ